MTKLIVDDHLALLCLGGARWPADIDFPMLTTSAWQARYTAWASRPVDLSRALARGLAFAGVSIDEVRRLALSPSGHNQVLRIADGDARDRRADATLNRLQREAVTAARAEGATVAVSVYNAFDARTDAIEPSTFVARMLERHVPLVIGDAIRDPWGPGPLVTLERLDNWPPALKPPKRHRT